MEIYRIHYKEIYDLIFNAISLMPLSPFYTLKRYKDIAYFYEALSDGVTLHYTKTELEPSIYVFDTSKFELKKLSSIPKFVEHGCYIVVVNKIEEDTLLEEALSES